MEQECIGSHGGVQLTFASALPIPESVTVTGALQVRAGTPYPGMAMCGSWGPADESALTTGTVRRLRVVSIVHGWRRVPGSRWRTNRLVPGSEWVYEMAQPPEELHSYELVPNDSGLQRRGDVLVVDLET